MRTRFCFILGLLALSSQALANLSGMSLSLMPSQVKASPVLLGHLTYQVLKKEGETWIVDDAGRTVDFGDCGSCSRGVTLSYMQMNGLENDLQQLGTGGISVYAMGDAMESLTLDIQSTSLLVRKAGMAKVGCSLEGSRIPVKLGAPTEIVYTIESPNPFGSEPIAEGTDMGPTKYKLVLSLAP